MENKGENWWTECVSDKIRKSADSRKAEEDKIKWHTHRGTSMINYVDFADLANIMGQNYDSHRPNISSVISGYKQPSKSAQSIEITGFIEKSKPPEIIFFYTLLPLTA